MIKTFANKLLPKKTNRRLFISWVLSEHIFGIIAIFRSLYCTKKLTGNFLPIQCLVYPNMKLGLRVDKTATIELKGKLHIATCWCASGSSFIEMRKNSQFIINNDFSIGQNVQIVVSTDASFICGGKNKTSGSGITSDTKILAEEYIEIGEDSIVAWDCFITDSDWHNVEGATKTKPVYIGQHVWLGHGVSVLKGAKISDKSIVGAKSIVFHIHNQPAILLAGCPAKIIKENVTWTR